MKLKEDSCLIGNQFRSLVEPAHWTTKRLNELQRVGLGAHVESSHCCRHLKWNEWLHKIVRTPSSIFSRQTAQVGNSDEASTDKAALFSSVV